MLLRKLSAALPFLGSMQAPKVGGFLLVVCVLRASDAVVKVFLKSMIECQIFIESQDSTESLRSTRSYSLPLEEFSI